MKKTLRLFAPVTVALMLALSPDAFADGKVPERVAHYEAKKAANLDEALANLREANAKLKELLGGEVGEYDIHDIHSLSYTLEEALAEVRKALAGAADDLESMHFYSEGLNRDEVIQYGNAYLDTVERVIR